MTTRQQATLARLAGEGDGTPFFLPDLTLWYGWHSKRGTVAAALGPAASRLPDAGARTPTLAEVCRALELPAWVTCAPWRLTWEGATVTTTEDGKERVICYETAEGTLTARWVLQDGDWWQTEYPVKTAADLPAARAAVIARTYVLDTTGLAERAAQVGDDGVLTLELPMRPYPDILHTIIGWQEGLLLWGGDGRAALGEMLELLEAKLAALVEQIAALPGSVVLAPDNLDGQFISPRAFRSSLSRSYATTAAAVHAGGKRLVVHAGGPVRRLLPLLAEAGVDAVEGIAGPPQGDATLAEARAAAGPNLVLWGGISQDYLVADAHEDAAFTAAVSSALADVRVDSRALLGVADRVPVEADLGRVRAILELAGRGAD